jgi:hypothetical protein
MRNLTVLYYTSNREGGNFEGRVKNIILENKGDLPLISVSQKPIDFGKNIVVGDHGASGFNMFRQVQIGLREVKTNFVISTEADCFYPPDYFQFVPPRNDVPYRNRNTWVMPRHRAFFWNKKESATHAQIVDTKLYLDRLNKLFKGAPDWSVEEKNFPKERLKKEDVFNKIEYWKSKNPVIQIKTKRSMRHYTHSERIDTHELPYWGKGVDFQKKYYSND